MAAELSQKSCMCLEMLHFSYICFSLLVAVVFIFTFTELEYFQAFSAIGTLK
jgi:hypothetical protein